MKRISVFFLCFCLVFCLSACKRNLDENSNLSFNDASSETTTSEPTECVTSVESVVSVSTESVESVESVVNVVSVVSVESTVSSETQKPVVAPVSVGYTVNDPQNTRGLSNQNFGFGFGVASGGVANSLSFSNQSKFDSMANVEALALDTKSTDKRMYLTFDCGYEYKNLTESILDTLNAKNVKAAFFVTLSYIKHNPQLVRRMIDEGHIVGNHSATHPVFPEISRTKMAEELFWWTIISKRISVTKISISVFPVATTRKIPWSL